eukprot:284815315_3
MATGSPASAKKSVDSLIAGDKAVEKKLKFNYLAFLTFLMIGTVQLIGWNSLLNATTSTLTLRFPDLNNFLTTVTATYSTVIVIATILLLKFASLSVWTTYTGLALSAAVALAYALTAQFAGVSDLSLFYASADFVDLRTFSRHRSCDGDLLRNYWVICIWLCCHIPNLFRSHVCRARSVWRHLFRSLDDRSLWDFPKYFGCCRSRLGPRSYNNRLCRGNRHDGLLVQPVLGKARSSRRHVHRRSTHRSWHITRRSHAGPEGVAS